MGKKIFLKVLLLLSFFNYGQKIEFGGMLNIENTTLSVPNGKITIYSNGGHSEGANSTGYKTNLGIGLFGKIRFDEEANHYVGVELFYDRTSSKEIPISYNAINAIPYFDIDIFHTGLRFNLGIGAGFILNQITFEEQSYEPKEIDLFGKVSLVYNIKDYCYLEIGMYPPGTSVVENYLNREKYYLGIKVPLSKYL